MVVSSVVLAALYARGLEGRPWDPPVRAWGAVEGVLRRSGASLESASRVLGDAGFWCEASCLEASGLLARAEALVDMGSLVTSSCLAYPSRWLSVLGGGAPPCVWASGPLPSFGVEVSGASASSPGDSCRGFGSLGFSGAVTVVGSRQLGRQARSFALGVGAEAARLGLGVISGGAAGADRLAVRACSAGGGASLEVWPCGLRAEAFRPASEASCVLAVAGPHERFSAALAMERNALLYAASPLAVVADCRLKEGGSWHGAVGALRRRLCRVAVRVPGPCAGFASFGASASCSPGSSSSSPGSPPSSPGSSSSGAPFSGERARFAGGLASERAFDAGPDLATGFAAGRDDLAAGSDGLATGLVADLAAGSVSWKRDLVSSSPGLEALEALGAWRLEHPELLAEAYAAALASPAWAQQSLFGVA